MAAAKLLALPTPPSAIFASSDDMAAGVLATAHKLGLDVPGQLSVAGFDDTDLAAVVWPPLTTIRQPVRDLAYAATDLLLSGRAEQVQLDFELISRASVGRG
jgi:LacI family transcriptional regulator